MSEEELPYGLGRVYVHDDRDQNYPMKEILPSAAPGETYRYWWSSAWWGNQGRTPQCVAYAWMHWLEDGPTTHFYEGRNFDPSYMNEGDSSKHQSLFKPEKVYESAQKKDRWPGENYDGTSVRAGAKVLKELGVIEEYRWASNANEVAAAILSVGPVVVGTPWYKDMFYPNNEGIIVPGGDQAGGHAYVLNGVNLDTGYFRLKNSWGRGWGNDGYAYIRMEDFEKLMNEWGEACIGLEKKLK